MEFALAFKTVAHALWKIAGKVLKCRKHFKNAGNVLEMQERFCKLAGKVLYPDHMASN